MTAVQDWHVILLRHLVDSREQRQEVLLRVDVLFTVSTQKDVLTLLQAKSLVYIRCFYLCQILVQHLSHGRTRDVGTLLRQSAVSQVATGMFRVGHIHVADDVHDAAVGLFGQALVLTPVASLHVEDGYVQALGSDDAQT